MINRILHLPRNQSLFLFGPRQTGKSTMLHSLFSEHSRYYDLLKTDEYVRLVAHPQLFREEVLARNPSISYIIVDEIQRIPLLLNEIHWLIEQPDAPFFILTGSSARSLKRTHANMLAGRALTYYLYPLTKMELGDRFDLSRVLHYGSLPSVYLEGDSVTAADRLRSYVETYLKEEIEQEAQLRQVGSFVRFLNIAASENGQQINYSNIARHTGVSYQTVKGYFQILEDTLVGQFIYPYSKSERRRLSKQPKFYFFDTGVVRALTQQLSVSLRPQTPQYGQAFEHFIVLEMLRYNHYLKKDYKLSYYRTTAGAEVDIIIETPEGRSIAVEIKSSDAVNSAQLRGLSSFKELKPDAELCCVSAAPYARKIKDVTIWPWQEFFTHYF